ncbi:MAG: restriction endonuclease subunit S [Rhodoferax sp.]
MSAVGKPGHHETAAGWIPADWSALPLGAIAFVRKDKGVAKQGLPCVELEHVEPETGRLLGWDSSGTQASIKTSFKQGDVLFGKLRPYLRKYAIAPFDGICTTEILAIHARDGQSDSRFLFHLMQGDGVFATVEALSYGTKMPRVSWTDLSNIVLGVPQLPEQQKIAAILTTVDDKLDIIARQIEATQTLKRGLMQTLFSRGVGTQDADGHWVPHTNFKDSELGEIPENWGALPIGMLFEVVERAVKMADEQNYRRVTVKRRHGGIELRDELLGRDIKVKSQFALEPDDFLISERQIVHGACGIVPSWLAGALVSNEYLVLKARDIVDVRYFNYLVQQLKYAKYFILCSQGVDIEKFLFKPKDWLKKLVPVPPVAEQARMANVLTTADEKLIALRAKQGELQQVKRGLMQKLLTGEWRVKVDETPVAVV